MNNRISESDIECLMAFFRNRPRLTQSHEVARFENEWSQWLDVKYSVFVNSGSSANLISMAALKHLFGTGEVIVPTLTWVSDIAAVLQNGFEPVFADINPRNLCMDTEQILSKLNNHTTAVFLTHTQGFNGLNDRLLSELARADIPLVEDVSEAHGATFKGRRLGSYGLISNFSFYYAHHMSTIEGGMVCTNDETIYEWLRILRSHGMIREARNDFFKQQYIDAHPDLSPDFIFALPAYNVRNTEIGAVLGRNQLKRLDEENLRRRENFTLFLNNLDPAKYRTDFDLQGSCNYALNLVLKNQDTQLRDRVEAAMKVNGIEFRRGSSGGGNQLRQPYLQGIVSQNEWEKYPETEHIHFFGYYIGNYPELKTEAIRGFCDLLNRL